MLTPSNRQTFKNSSLQILNQLRLENKLQLMRLVAGLGIQGAFTVRMINAKHVLISQSIDMDFSRLWLRRICKGKEPKGKEVDSSTARQVFAEKSKRSYRGTKRDSFADNDLKLNAANDINPTVDGNVPVDDALNADDANAYSELPAPPENDYDLETNLMIELENESMEQYINESREGKESIGHTSSPSSLEDCAVRGKHNRSPSTEENFQPGCTFDFDEPKGNTEGLRSVDKQKHIHWLCLEHKPQILVIIEPKVNLDERYFYRWLGFDKVVHNANSKIWCFWKNEFTCDILISHEQYLHVRLSSTRFPNGLLCSLVYAKHTRAERRELWDDLRNIDPGEEPWLLGEKNTKYFHSLVKKKRKQSHIHQIQHKGTTLTSREAIQESVVEYFTQAFSDEGDTVFDDLHCIPTLLSEEDVAQLHNKPTIEDVKTVVFDMCSDSTAGPDGFSALFTQCCWDIIAEDLFEAVLDFFASSTPPKSFTTTSVVLVIMAEYLSRGLDNLFYHHPRLRFFARSDLSVSHLAFIDDIIIFTKGGRKDLGVLMNFLKHYESITGRRINEDKSSFTVDKKTPNLRIQVIQQATGFRLKFLQSHTLVLQCLRETKKALYLMELSRKYRARSQAGRKPSSHTEEDFS
ncbi:UNVERIFIED_CONTAM: hypothetical protein Scaly_3118700 [Sesamum calycinum]|uniref:Reverse transcriptase domain-containing protein n=1 Tax=Sesamum calycinum TaxID=2727403 RepID=A0AAW2JJC5_9LAMI